METLKKDLKIGKYDTVLKMKLEYLTHPLGEEK